MIKEAQALVDEVKQLYSLPTIYYEIDKAIKDPNSTTTTIGRIIGEDGGLAARLLRLVNSAFYSFPTKIDTISRAVTVVGTKQLRDLVLATSVIDLFKGVPEEIVNMELFWRHSIACGVAAKVIATQRHETNVESYFVSGLLHDLGSLIIYTQLPEKSKVILNECKQYKEQLHIVERRTIVFDHAIVGGLLVQNWQLPKNLIESIMYHHAPHKSRSHSMQSSIIHLADVIVDALRFGTNGERYVPTLVESAWDSVGLSPSMLSKIIPIIERQYEETVKSILHG